MNKKTGKIDRRSMMALLTAGTAGEIFTAAAPKAEARTLDRPREIVVVGGGMSGTTVAKYLKLWSAAAQNPVNVTLIVAAEKYISCIMSNKVLTGEKTLAQLEYGYDQIQARGVSVVVGEVGSVDRDAKTVTLTSGQFPDSSATKAYDRLILAPGIDFLYKSYNGSTNEDINFINMTAEEAPEKLPHAWKAGPTTTLLREQLVGIANGANVIVSIPKAPFRCPPGPYERVCVIAEWLKKNRPASRLVVLDENPKVLVEPQSFGKAFSVTYSGNVQYYPGASIASVNYVDAGRKVITLRTGAWLTNALTNAKLGTAVTEFTAGVVNLIPQQASGRIVRQTLPEAVYLDASGRWGLVNELSYESRFPGIHIIGDSISSGQPKAGHIGNQEAKVCADAILRLEFSADGTPYPKPVTNSACYTPITSTTATWLTAVFGYDTTLGKMVLIDPPGIVEPSGGTPTTTAYSQMNRWFAGLMDDTFG